MSEKIVANSSFSHMELASFCGQMAFLLKSGISALEGLELLLEDTTDPKERALLEMLLLDLNAHGSLEHAFRRCGCFPDYLIQMVKIGEETGTLDDVMAALQSHYEREADIASSIKSAVTYPLIMLGMMIVVILVLLIKVMPIFQQVFLQLGTEMTGVSRLLMNLGEGLSRYAIFFVLLLFAVILLGVYLIYTPSGKRFRVHLGYRIPATRKIQEEISACRFASGMALTLGSGLSQERCLELVKELTDNPYFERKLDVCIQQIGAGSDLSPALSASGIFTGMYARMTSVGAKTGTMDQMMAQIARLYQEEIDTRMNRLLSILEPTLVILLSLVVGIILLSVMLPLMGIMSGI